MSREASRWTRDVVHRLMPLSGVLAVALVLGGHLVHGSVRAARDDMANFSAFYRAHDSRIYVGSILLGLAAFFFVAFAATLRTRLQEGDEGADAAAAFGFAGATILAVGLTVTAGIGVTLGHQPARLDPSAVQALHALFFDLFAPVSVGGAVFLIGKHPPLRESGRHGVPPIVTPKGCQPTTLPRRNPCPAQPV
jgi:hypothetical protein